MKITLGLSELDKPDDIITFIESGADEFFAGIMPRKWYDRYGWELSLNRREHQPQDQFTTYESLKKIITIVHQKNRKIFITLNAHQYSNEQIPFIKEIVEEIERYNPDGYIVADLALMILLRKWGIQRPLDLSIGATCFNSETIRYFHKKIKVNRIIIPRKMSIKEIKILVKKCQDLNIEFEVMSIYSRCYFSDGYCFTWHSAMSHFCSYFGMVPREIMRRFPGNWKQIIEEFFPQSQFNEKDLLNKFFKKNSFDFKIKEEYKLLEDLPDLGLNMHPVAVCGLCAIPQFKKMGISTLKIPTRGAPSEPGIKRKFLDIVRKVIDHPNPTRKFCKSLINNPDFCSKINSCFYYLGDS